MKKLKVALIGCGRISVSYLAAFQKLADQIQVLAAVDLDLEKAKDFAAHFSSCQAFTDYRDLFALPLDAVHIALPHYLHCQVAIDCLNHGFNVLTEKPMALSLADADAMIAASEKNHKQLGVIFQTRYNSSVQTLKKMKDEGAFGKILSVSSILTWDRDKEYYSSSDWKGTWDKEGGGVLIDQAIHSLDRVLYLLGETPSSIKASINNFSHPYIDVEDTVSACLKFLGGTVYNLYATDCSKDDTPITINFVGEKGSFGLRQDVGYSDIGEQHREYREIEKSEIIGKGYWGTTHVMELEDFYSCLRENRRFYLDGREGKKALEAVKGIYLAALTHQEISLPFTDLDVFSHPELYSKIKIK